MLTIQEMEPLGARREAVLLSTPDCAPALTITADLARLSLIAFAVLPFELTSILGFFASGEEPKALAPSQRQTRFRRAPRHRSDFGCVCAVANPWCSSDLVVAIGLRAARVLAELRIGCRAASKLGSGVHIDNDSGSGKVRMRALMRRLATNVGGAFSDPELYSPFQSALKLGPAPAIIA